MPLIITTKDDFSSHSGGSSDHSHPNLSILNALKVDNNGNLLFNNNNLGENAIEVSYDIILSPDDIANKFIELPYDCNADRAITVVLENVPLIKGVDWDIIENSYPIKDRISWLGLHLELIAQVGDNVSITYYKKNSF